MILDVTQINLRIAKIRSLFYNFHSRPWNLLFDNECWFVSVYHATVQCVYQKLSLMLMRLRFFLFLAPWMTVLVC